MKDKENRAYGKLSVELLDQEGGVLLAVVLEASWIVGEEIVVEVVVAAHANEEDAASDRAGCFCCTQPDIELV